MYYLGLATCLRYEPLPLCHPSLWWFGTRGSVCGTCNVSALRAPDTLVSPFAQGLETHRSRADWCCRCC